MSHLENLDNFLKSKAKEVVAELLEKNDYAALAHHALQVEASFAPAMKVLLPELQSIHQVMRETIEPSLRGRYYDERLLELGEYIKQLDEKTKGFIAKLARLNQALEEAKRSEPEALQDFDPTTVDYNAGLEILAENRARMERNMAQYTISSEITDVTRLKLAHLEVVAKWTKALELCASEKNNTASSALSQLPQEKKERYQAELKADRERFDSESKREEHIIRQRAYRTYIETLGDALKSSANFDEKEKLTEIVKNLKLYLEAEATEEAMQSAYVACVENYERVKKDVGDAQEKITRVEQKTLPQLITNIKKYKEELLPAYSREAMMYSLKKWFYWALAAAAACTVTLPLVALYFNSALAFLISIPLAIVAFITTFCFIGAGNVNRDWAAEKIGLIARTNAQLACDNESLEQYERELPTWKAAIPEKEARCDTAYNEMNDAVAKRDACTRQKAEALSAAKQFWFFQAEDVAGTKDTANTQVLEYKSATV